VVGQSAGGWGALALAAQSPPEVGAILNMAGGRGGWQGNQPNQVCRPENLVRTTGVWGATARTPTLWIYAANDTFFSPALARDMASAWRLAGGRLVVHQLPPFGRDGHGVFFGPGGSGSWGPLVADFLK
jgi:pimeloyl-ACP methyl ester carboxylesterase